MCIGLPMRVIEVMPGQALCRGRGAIQRVETALVGEPLVGDWLLVFLGSARERIDVQRAAEVNSALDLLQAAMQPTDGNTPTSPTFTLPSSWDAAALAALTGSTGPSPRNTQPPRSTEP